MVIALPNGTFPDLEDEILISEWIEAGRVVLDNIPMWVEGGVGYQLANVYGTKQRQGEPGPDDHPYNSTHTQRTWVSGQLVRDLQEAADVGKYWNAHAWTQTRGQLGHALKVDRIPLPEGVPGGMLVPHCNLNDNFYWTAGNADGVILEFVEGPPHSFRTPGGVGERRFTGTVTNVGVAFRCATEEDNSTDTWLYIPTSTGYTRMSEGYVVQHAPSGKGWATVGFCTHQDHLFRLTTRGQIFALLRHDDDWQLVGTIPDGSEPRQIWRDYDDDGNRVVAVSTTTGMWMLDYDNRLMIETDLTFPEHGRQGHGACAWRADTFVSVGIGIHRKTGSLVTAAGLDADDGLPDPFAAGFITDLEPSYNVLVAAVAGEEMGAARSPIPTTETYGVTQAMPYPIVSLGTSANFLGLNRMGAIFCWNGLGWSEIYTWNRPPTRAVVAQVRSFDFDERYQHLFFGDYDNGAYAVHLPTTYYNPLMSPNLPLERTGFLEESRIDWNTPDVPKVAKQLNIKVSRIYDQLYPKRSIQDTPIYHNKIEVICNWRDLDGIDHTSEDHDILDGPGPYPFSLDSHNPHPYLTIAVTPPDPNTGESRAGVRDNSRRVASIGWERYKNTSELLATGLPHEQIWFTYRFIGDTEDRRPLHLRVDGDDRWNYTGGVIEWRTIIARKWMRPTRIWTFQIDAQKAIEGVSEEQTLKILDRICLKKGGVPMVVGDSFTIVDVTRLDGTDPTGVQVPSTRTVTCLEFTDFTYEHPIGASR